MACSPVPWDGGDPRSPRPRWQEPTRETVESCQFVAFVLAVVLGFAHADADPSSPCRFVVAPALTGSAQSLSVALRRQVDDRVSFRTNPARCSPRPAALSWPQ